MKELIGKSCKLQIKIREENLFYSVKEILEITPTHISFIDKYDNYCLHRKDNIVQISQVE